MTYDIIMAVDPGGTTGVAYWYTDTGQHVGGELKGRGNFMMSAKVFLDTHADQRILVVMEAFIITARTLKVTREYDALYIIGALEDRCSDYPLVDFAKLQSASDAKNFVSDDRLKKAGMWKKTTGGHANDASRHLFLQMAKLGLINPTEVDRRA